MFGGFFLGKLSQALEKILEINKVESYESLDLFLPCIESYELLSCQ